MGVFYAGFCQAQSNLKHIAIEQQNGSDEARKIMVSDFYYDILDNWSPFGNDTGNDTYHLYIDWRAKYSFEKVRSFVNEQLIDFGYANFDLSVDGSEKTKLTRIVDEMHNKYIDLNAIDNMLISLAFTQLFLEGHIQSEVKVWAEAAISREVIFLDFWSDKENEIKDRKNRLDQMLNDILKAN